MAYCVCTPTKTKVRDAITCNQDENPLLINSKVKYVIFFCSEIRSLQFLP